MGATCRWRSASARSRGKEGRLVACIVQDSTARRRRRRSRSGSSASRSTCSASPGSTATSSESIPPGTSRSGIPSRTLLDRAFLKFVHQDDREATLAEFRHLQHGADVIAFENRYRCKDGTLQVAALERGPGARAGADLRRRPRHHLPQGGGGRRSSGRPTTWRAPTSN